MVDEDRYCIDVVTQIGAVRAALEKVAMGLLDDHARTCVLEAEGAERERWSAGAERPRTLRPVSYFRAVRVYSAVELCIFTGLCVVAIGGFSEQAEQVLGWTHGFGWIALCIAVAVGCRAGTTC